MSVVILFKNYLYILYRTDTYMTNQKILRQTICSSFLGKLLHFQFLCLDMSILTSSMFHS